MPNKLSSFNPDRKITHTHLISLSIQQRKQNPLLKLKVSNLVEGFNALILKHCLSNLHSRSLTQLYSHLRIRSNKTHWEKTKWDPPELIKSTIQWTRRKLERRPPWSYRWVGWHRWPTCLRLLHSQRVSQMAILLLIWASLLPFPCTSR